MYQTTVSFQHEFNLTKHVLCEDLLINRHQERNVVLEVLMTESVLVIKNGVIEGLGYLSIQLSVSRLLS